MLTSSGHEGASYTVTGPEVLTYGQVAGLLTEVLGREVAYVDVPPEQFPGSLRSAGLDPWLADALRELNQLYRQHHAEVVTDEVQKATGRPARSLQDWLADNRAAFTGQPDDRAQVLSAPLRRGGRRVGPSPAATPTPGC